MVDNGWIIAVIALNLISFIVMGSDKQRAIRHRWRIAEGTLLGLALFGGSLGVLLGMVVFHHKTNKPRFILGIPLILGIQSVLILQRL
jgi:uncharacterized membrane protein YsdA (DUF1294 family)